MAPAPTLRDGVLKGDDERTLAPLPAENIRQTRLSDIKRGPLGMARPLVNAFSTAGRRHPPPPPFKSESAATVAPSDELAVPKSRHIRLITIGASHFCEKVRWGLDLLESDSHSDTYYTEDAHPPGLASLATVQASDGEASRVPMVVLDEPLPADSSDPPGVPPDGRGRNVLYESSLILQCLCPFLYPPTHADRIVVFERHLGERLGATARCFVYHHALDPQHHQYLAKIANEYSSGIESILFRLMLKGGLVGMMRKTMNVDEASAEASKQAVREVFEKVSDMLTEGGKNHSHIMDAPLGDSNGRANAPGINGRHEEKVGFTAADLTFAALSSVVLQPPELSPIQECKDWRGRPLPVPPALAALRDELRATPAGQHAMNMYRYHRFGARTVPVSRSNGAEEARRFLVVPKTAQRNRIPWFVVAGFVIAVVAGAVVRWDHR